MSAAFIFKHWRKLAAGGVTLLVIFLIGQIVDRVRDYGQARYEAGLNACKIKKLEGENSGLRDHIKTTEDVQAETKELWADIKQRLDERSEAERVLTDRNEQQARQAQQDQREYERMLNDLLESVGPADCSSDPVLHDETVSSRDRAEANYQGSAN